MSLARLLDAGTAEERRLLGSAKHDCPAPALQQGLLNSLDLGIASASHAGPQLVEPNALAHGAIPAAASAHPVLNWVLVKWVGIAGVALSIGAGSGFALGSAWTHEQVASGGDTTGVAQASATLGERSVVSQAAASVADAQAPLAATLTTTHSRTLVARTPSQPAVHELAKEPATGLANEVRLVDDARTALRRGDAATCLRLIGERQRRVRNGVLGPEAALVRIEALKLTGDHAAVQTEGERFLEQHPSGPLAARVRVILGL